MQITHDTPRYHVMLHNARTSQYKVWDRQFSRVLTDAARNPIVLNKNMAEHLAEYMNENVGFQECGDRG